MEAQMKKYNTYQNDLKSMLACSGIWPGYEKYPEAVRKFLISAATFFTLGVCFGSLNFCIHFGTNISLLCRGGGIFLGYSLVFLKIFVLGIYQKDLRWLNENVSKIFTKDLEEPENRQHLLAYFPIIRRFFYTFNYFLIANNVVMIVLPLSLIRHGKYVRMLPNIPPFSYEPGGVVHFILSGFEILSFFFLWSITCGVDSVFGYYTLHVVGELRLLSTHFQSLKSGENYKKQLKELVDKYSLLVKSHHILEKIFGILAIWLGVTCAVSLCTLIFQISKLNDMGTLRIIFVINYSIIKMLQAFSYSWFGNIMSTESQACLDSIYSAEWPGTGDTSFMGDSVIILSQKPMTFKAKGVMTLDMNLFAGIVNTSVSYFFLLQFLEEELGS